MARRPRHGLHLVPDRPLSPGEPRLVVHQDSVVLRLEGHLDGVTGADLRLLLAPFTLDGGPFELVLDLAGVDTVGDGGLDPVLETAEALSLRGGVLRLADTSRAVEAELSRLHGGRTGRVEDADEPD
jgi:anti-anti-sigma factor